MRYINITLTFLILLTVIVIARSIALSNQNERKNKREFYDREAKANAVRKADISGLDYIMLSLDTLPLTASASAQFIKLIDELKGLADRKILNLSKYSNTDLKLMYGPANLDELSACDQNYLTLIRVLNSIGELLIEENNSSDAKAFLEYSISIGTDISSSYAMLGNIYLDENDNSSFKKLLKMAENNDSLSGPIIVNKLNNIKSAHK